MTSMVAIVGVTSFTRSHHGRLFIAFICSDDSHKAAVPESISVNDDELASRNQELGTREAVRKPASIKLLV